MSRYIDADNLKDTINEWLDTVGNALVGKGLSYYGELMGCIDDTPTADVVEVARCKDCRYARPLKDLGWDFSCRYFNTHSVNADDFCSYGKRCEE